MASQALKYIRALLCCHFLLLALAAPVCSEEIRVGYEPFLVRQFDVESVITYQAGNVIATPGTYQAKHDLFFQMAFVRYKKMLPLSLRNLHFSLETGVSANPLPVRKEWVIPAINNEVSGNISYPIQASNSDYWSGHYIDQGTDGVERYLIEETSLAHLPMNLVVDGTFSIGKRIRIKPGLQAGLSIFHISVNRRKLQGSPTARYSEFDRSATHLARLLGLNVILEYGIHPEKNLFLDLSANGVSNISNFGLASGGEFAGGYRFDGLRYNAKIGVAWKI